MEKIIIDTDLSIGQFGHDVDDGLAIILALNSPELEIHGITKVYGNTSLERVNRYLEELILMWERSGGKKVNFSVSTGADKPIHKIKQISKFFYPISDKNFESNTFFSKNLFQNLTSKKFIDEVKEGKIFPAIKFLADNIMEFPNELTLVPIGPLTNIALLLIIFPETIPQIKKLSIMGGKLDGYEFNFANDPIAANIVLNAPIKTEIAGLEVCTAQQFNKKHRKQVADNGTILSSYVTKKIGSWLQLNRMIHLWKSNSGFYPFDACAIINLIYPDIIKRDRIPVKIVYPTKFLNRFSLSCKTIIEEEKLKNYRKLNEDDRSRFVDWGKYINSELLMETLISRLK